jgi:hypothetical protein
MRLRLSGATTTALAQLSMDAMKQVSLTQSSSHPAKTLMSALKKASLSLMQVISLPNVHATYVSLPPR